MLPRERIQPEPHRGAEERAEGCGVGDLDGTSHTGILRNEPHSVGYCPNKASLERKGGKQA